MMKFSILCVLTAGLGWTIGSPYYVAYQMQQAADANNSEDLAHYVDFPALQTNAKQRLESTIDSHTQGKDSILSALGKGLGRLLSDQVVEATVTPEGLTELLQGAQKVRSNTQVGTEETDTAEETSKLEETASSDNVSLAYTAWDKFAIDVNTTESRLTRLILERRGLNWKLADVRLVKNESGDEG